MRKRQILIIQPECHDRSHDSNDLVEQMIAGFPQETYEITSLFLQGRRTPQHPESRAAQVVYFNLPDKALQGLRLRLLWRLYQFCCQHRFDVVICNRYKPVHMLMQLQRWLKIPLCIGISHGLGEYKTLRRRLATRVHINRHWHFVGVSQAVRDYLLSVNCGFNTSNTSVIDNAIDVDSTEQEFLERDKVRAEFGLTPDRLVLGSIGRLVRVKGHAWLLQAFAQIHEQFPNACLLIIGEGKERAKLEALAQELGITEKLLLPGFRNQAARLARAFDLWILPSLSEGLPRALLEGMCARLPIIGSNIPALRPIVEGAGGIAVPVKDVSALAMAITHCLSLSQIDREKAGERAYRHLRQHYDLDAYQKGYRDLVEAWLTRNLEL